MTTLRFGTILYYCTLLLSLAALISHILWVNLTNDTQMFMHYALHTFKHGGLYQDWIEINPPLYIIFLQLPVITTLYIPISPAAALHGWASALCIISLIMIYTDLKKKPIHPSDIKLYLGSSAFLLCILPVFFGAFGDREHLLFVFSLPWCLQMLMGCRPSYTRLAYAIPGFLLKPYNILFLIFLCVFAGKKDTPLKERLLAPDIIITGICGILYLILIYIFFPGYIYTVIPLLKLTYPSIQVSFLTKVIVGIIALFFVASIYLIALTRRFAITYGWPVYVITGIVIYLLNGGWNYTYYLIAAPLFLYYCHIAKRTYATDYIPEWKGIRYMAITLITFISVTTIINWYQEIVYNVSRGHSSHYHNAQNGFYSDIRNAADERFILLSTTLWASNIALYNNIPQNEFAFDFLWPLPWLMKNAGSPQYTWARNTLDNHLIQAFEKQPSATVIVDTSQQHRGLPENTDILGFLLKSDKVRTAFADYTHTQTIDYCNPQNAQPRSSSCRFEIWKKKERH